jgi:LysR family transcriptional regulator, transcriptional activator of nhaA
MQHPNYKHLYYFWVIAHEKSLSRAAERLHLTPQTLSGQLAKLEHYVGSTLFDRRGRTLVLSETGHLVLEYADSMFHAGQELVEILDGRRLGRLGRLRIGVSDVVPKLLAYRFLRKAVEAFDDYFLTVFEGKHEELVTSLAAHRIDVVISDRPSDEAMVATYSHLLGTTEVSIFARKDRARSLTRNFPQNLNGAPMLLPTANTLVRRDLERWFDAEDIKPLIVAEFEDSALLKVFGAEGLGCFPAPRAIALDIAPQYGVREIGVTSVIEKYYAITVERRIKNAAALAVVATAKSALDS